jgi:S-adenosylmethionine decarboxylase
MERGKHLLLDWYGCNTDRISNEYDLVALLLDTAKVAGCRVLNYMGHQFEPQGATAIVMLAESHMSAHYSPEHDYISIDVYTCMPSMMPEKALKYLRKELKPKDEKTQTLERG